MSKAPFWPLAPDAYLADTRQLTTEQHGAYLLLLMSLWRHEGTLPFDEKKLARIAGVSPKRWSAIWRDLKGFFTVEDATSRSPVLTQHRLKEDWKRIQSRRTANRESGRRGAEVRWKNTRAKVARDNKRVAKTVTNASMAQPSNHPQKGNRTLQSNRAWLVKQAFSTGASQQ